jgi:hypothetical protein
MTPSLVRSKAMSTLCLGTTLVATTTGCGTLAEVTAARQFAKMQDQALEIFPKIGSDIFDSCMRQASYKVLLSPPRRTDDDRMTAVQVCEIEGVQARNSVNKTHGLIIGYLASLGNLAKGATIDYKPEINNISKALKTIPGLNIEERQSAVDAGTRIATFLAEIIASGYQRQKLKEVIVSSDKPLQVVVYSLSKSVDNYYLGSVLAAERSQLDIFYSTPIGLTLVQPRTTSVDQYVVYSLNSTWQEKQAITREKTSIARSYLGLLKEISCEHSKLKDTFLHDAARSAENANMFCPKENQASISHSNSPASISSQYTLRKYQQAMAKYSSKLDRLSREAKRVYSMN